MKHTFEIEEADRQALVLAIAKLTFSRPGWSDYLRRIAESLSAEKMFDGFVAYGPELSEQPAIEKAVEEGPTTFRLRFQVNGVIALWGVKYQLPIGTEEIRELMACLQLDPEAILPIGEVRP